MTDDTTPKSPAQPTNDPKLVLKKAETTFRSDRPEAVRKAKAALDMARSQKDLVTVSRALCLLADAERLGGKLEKAMELGAESVKTAKQAGDRKAEAGAVNLLGAIAWHRGEYDLAIQWFREALNLHEALGNDRQAGHASGNLALMYYEKGDLVQALEYSRRCLETREQLGDHHGIGEANINLGLVYADLGDWEQALECYFRGLAEMEVSTDVANMALAYSNIGEVYMRRGKLDRAKSNLDRALELARGAESKYAEVEALGLLGEVALLDGDHARAEACFQQNRDICVAIEEHKELAETLRRWAELDLARGDLAGAGKRLEESLSFCARAGARREEGNVHRVMGELNAQEGDNPGAGREFVQSADILRGLGRNFELACTLVSQGRFLSGTTGEGNSALSEALSIFENLGAAKRAEEVERLLGGPAAVREQVDLLHNLTELVCAEEDLGGCCESALALLTERLGAQGAAIYLRDGQVFRHGQITDTAGSVEPGSGQAYPLEFAGSRVGTLVVRGSVDTSQLKTPAKLLAMRVSQTRARSATVEKKPDRRFPDIIGADTTMKGVFETIEQVAPTNASVLILGESGTGKELVARTLHELSGRKRKPFVAVNCAAIPEALLESELFGIEKGTATGVTAREGKFEIADTGTIFLDEIGDMSLPLQAKMLRVLQDRTFERIGARHPVEVDVRVLAATNRDLEKAMDMGAFRRDLFYRLNVIAIQIPPLRDRKADIPTLTSYFVRQFSDEYGRNLQGVSDDCLACLIGQEWTGNVRELLNVIERGVILAKGKLVEVEDLPPGLQVGVETGAGLHEAKEQARAAAVSRVEQTAVISALEKSGWVVKKAAESLGISRVQLYRIMKKHGLKRPVAKK